MKKLLLTACLALSPFAGYAGTYTFNTPTTSGSNYQSLAHGTAYTWGLTGGSTSEYGKLLTSVKTANTSILSATLTIKDIWDWAPNNVDKADVLYVNILNGLAGGYDSYRYNSNSPSADTSFGPNFFAAGTAGNTSYAHSQILFNNANGSNSLGDSLLRAPQDSTNILSYNGQNNPGTWSDPAGGADQYGIDLVITFSDANKKLLEYFLENDQYSSSNPTVGLGFAAECHYYNEGMTLTIVTGTPETPPPSVPDNANTLILLGSVLAMAAGVRRFAKKSAA